MKLHLVFYIIVIVCILGCTPSSLVTIQPTIWTSDTCDVETSLLQYPELLRERENLIRHYYKGNSKGSGVFEWAKRHQRLPTPLNSPVNVSPLCDTGGRMSVELFAYADDPSPVAIADLAAECKSLGCEVRVIRNDDTPAPEGVVQSDDAIVGWHPSLFGNRSARTAAERADWKAIGELQEREAVGACVVEVWNEPDQYNDVNELNELEDVYGPEYVALRKGSRVRWYIRLAAGRNVLSVELAEVVLRSMLKLRGGVFEDPQSGEFEIV